MADYDPTLYTHLHERYGRQAIQGRPPQRLQGVRTLALLLSCPGALDWNLWIEAERDQIFSAVESIAVARVSASSG